jgi:hypothetical protein
MFYIEVKAKLSLCLINKVPRQEDLQGSGYIRVAPLFLTSTLD